MDDEAHRSSSAVVVGVSETEIRSSLSSSSSSQNAVKIVHQIRELGRLLEGNAEVCRCGSHISGDPSCSYFRANDYDTIKMAELVEYSHMLDMADECEDPSCKWCTPTNFLFLAATSFFIYVYYAFQRTWKPFNLILSEIYEMVNHGGITFIAEHVSHHPPVGAAHRENEHFIYDITSKVKTKFLKNSIDICPVGRWSSMRKGKSPVSHLKGETSTRTKGFCDPSYLPNKARKVGKVARAIDTMNDLISNANDSHSVWVISPQSS